MNTLGRLAIGVFLVVITPHPLAASELIQITTSPGIDRHPSWTVGDDAIVFESNRDGHFHLYKISLQNGETEQLTFGAADDKMPEVSPDGTQITYVASIVGPNGAVISSGLNVVSIDGDTPIVLVPDDGHIKWHPTWTPDGNTIYYLYWGSGVEDIYRVSSAGGTPEKAIDIDEETYPRVSPDGSRISFSFRPHGGPYNVVEAPLADPTNMTFWTQETMNTSQSAYSPDGIFIAYASRKVQGRMELFEVDRSTGVHTRLTFDADAFDPGSQFPEYSHDGSLIAFSSARVEGNENIWILTREGQEPPFGNVLTVGEGRGLPGGDPVAVPVLLETAQTSPALEFQVHDVPDRLRVTGVQVRGRAAAMTASSAANAGVHVLVYSPSGGAIPPGSGPILDLLVSVDSPVDLGDVIALELSDVVMADRDGNAVDVEAVSGSFLIARLNGDINGDNRVDVGDLVRLVEIILGLAHPPSPAELAAADCNEDETVNALDVVCLTDAILSAPSSPSIATGTGETTVDMIVRAEEPVRGFQFGLKPDEPAPRSTAELAPLSLEAKPGGRWAVAFDSRGGEWAPGTRVPFQVASMPSDVRAYGEGGRALAVEITGNEIHVGTPLPAGLRVLPASPNPFRATTGIHFSTDMATTVRATIYDIRGAKVSTIPERVVPAGRHTLPWEARDDQGSMLAGGIYIAVVEAAGKKAAVRLTHLGN